MSYVSGRINIRHAGVILALACFYLCVIGVKDASAFTVETDIAKVVEKLNSEPHLENFNGYSTADKSAVERGLADTEYLNKEWAGRSLADFLTHYGITGLPEGAVDTVNGLEASVETGTQGLADTSATTYLAGGEGLDAASGAFSLTPLVEAVPTIALGVGAFAAGYYIGENLVQVFTGSREENRGEPTFTSGIEVEAIKWQAVTPCSGRFCESFSEQLDHPENFVEGNRVHDAISSFSGYAGGGAVFMPFAKPSYILTGKFSSPFTGSQYWANGPAYAPHSISSHWPFARPETENESEGCSSAFSFSNQVEGWPPHLNKSQLFYNTEPYTAECVPHETVGCPFECHTVNKPVKIVVGSTVGIWRNSSQMPVDFPKPGRTCAEGFTCNHTEVPAYPSLGTLLESLPHSFEHETHENLNHTIEHFEGSSTPLPGTTTIPSCAGLLGTACKSRLEEHGFTEVEIDPVTWEHAVLTKPAHAVISTSPTEGSYVETDHKVEVITNPATMPIVIPTPGHETATQYKERLETLGEHDVTISTRAENDTNPGVGPEEVAGTVPNPGRPTNPDGSTPIRVEENPPSASAPPEETHGIGGPTLPGFNIPEFKVECKGFPFGVPCWVAETVESWSASSVAPEWGIGNFTVMGHVIPGAKFKLEKLEPIMEKVRVAMVIFATIGLVLLFYRFARGGTPESGSGTADVGGTETHMDGPNEYRVS